MRVLYYLWLVLCCLCVLLPCTKQLRLGSAGADGACLYAGFKTATQAAAAGGVTTFVDMPLNNYPTTTTAQLLSAKRRASKVGPRGTFHTLLPRQSKTP